MNKSSHLELEKLYIVNHKKKKNAISYTISALIVINCDEKINLSDLTRHVLNNNCSVCN